MITFESPELVPAREIARVALTRTAIRFNITRDMEDASKYLSLALHKSMLRNHPLALKAVERRWGVEATARALDYLSVVGFPEGPLKIPRYELSDQRRTPPEIRALWKPCVEAVDEVLTGLSEASRKALTLHLSWGVHQAFYNNDEAYRWEIDELRRIRHKGRFSAASWVILVLPALSALAL